MSTTNRTKTCSTVLVTRCYFLALLFDGAVSQFFWCYRYCCLQTRFRSDIIYRWRPRSSEHKMAWLDMMKHATSKPCTEPCFEVILCIVEHTCTGSPSLSSPSSMVWLVDDLTSILSLLSSRHTRETMQLSTPEKTLWRKNIPWTSGLP